MNNTNSIIIYRYTIPMMSINTLYIYTIYIYCQKIYNLFTRVLEAGGKAIIWRAFMACFAASANKLYI